MPVEAPDEAPPWFSEALAAPVVDGSIEVEGCPIAFRRWGDPTRPGLLLVHGGGAHSRWWDHVAPFFAGECCVAALDLSGHGESGRRPVYHLEHWAEEIMAVATSGASADPPVVVAHSLGGFATFVAAALHGERLEGVIVVDSPVRRRSPEQEAGRNREAFGPLRVYPSRQAVMDRFRTVPAQPGLLPFVVRHVREHSVRQVPGGWTWKFDPTFFANVGEPDPRLLGRVPCRVAVLRAEHGLVTPDVGEHMYELLGRSSPVIEIPLAHHHVMLDQPIALVTAVRSLLADWRHSRSLRSAP